MMFRCQFKNPSYLSVSLSKAVTNNISAPTRTNWWLSYVKTREESTDYPITQIPS